MRMASVMLALARWGMRRTRALAPRRILVLHHLLLGDTLMLTGLIAKLRACYPQADIVLTVRPALAPLYAGRPYGITVHPFDPRDMRSFTALLRAPHFDLAILPADNRWSWLARALGIGWIIGIAGDVPARKNWPVDELLPYSPMPTAFVETAAELVAGPPPAPYRVGDWPMPVVDDVPDFGQRYAVLHVSAGSLLKLWPAPQWRSLAEALEARGLRVVWSTGPEESAILDVIDSGSARGRIAGTLCLAQLWHVLARASLFVSLDTGVAHLGRLTGVPAVTLFGPGSALICGSGVFFAAMPQRLVSVDPFPCRDQTVQFFRTLPWVQRCERMVGPRPRCCPHPLCMDAISVDAVLAAVDSLAVQGPLPR